MQPSTPWTGEAPLTHQGWARKIYSFRRRWTTLQYRTNNLGQRRSHRLFMHQQNLRLGGMNIDIDFIGRQIQVEHKQGMLSFRQQATIAPLQRIVQRAGMDPASIYKQRHKMPIALCQHTIANITMNAKMRALTDIDRVEHLAERHMIQFP